MSGKIDVSGYDLPGFPAEDGALARQAPVVAGEVATLPQHAMARHHERYRIASNGRTHVRSRWRMIYDVAVGRRQSAC